ncbi:MAG: glycosyltransferase family 39 protein [Candidatus Lernaella stagnicola]|nr:glycosyltransferase family 39 protein [Candidatus Lernaella stagnicola]
MNTPADSAPSPWFCRLVMGALLVFVLVGHVAWLSVDSSLTGYDELAFFEHLVKYRDLLRTAPPTEWFGWLGFSSYPALPFLAGHAFVEIAGPTIVAVRLTGVFFHLLWVWLVFLVGRRLNAPLAGLVAAFVVALSPQANILARHYASFAVCGAMLTLAAYALVATRFATGRRGVILAGLAMAAALLSERGTPLLFLGGMLAYGLIDRWTSADRRRGRAVGQLALAVGLAALLAAPYLAGFVKANLAHTLAQSRAAVIPGRPWTFYWHLLRPFLIGEAVTPLLLVALGVGAWRRDRRLLFVLLWFAVPFVILSAVATRDMVYAMSLTTPLALLAGFGAYYLPRRWWRAPLFGLLLFLMLLTWIRVGNPEGEIARGTRDVNFFGLYNGYNTPTFAARPELDLQRLWPAIDGLNAAPGDVWVFTGTPDDDTHPRRREVAQTVQRLMQLRGTPGRSLVARGNLFPDFITPTGDEEHIVLVPAIAAPPGSRAAFLARPVFDAAEHDRFEPEILRRWQSKLALVQEKKFAAGLVAVTVWRASVQLP